MCKHLTIKTVEYETVTQSDSGIEYAITSYTYCMDCGETVPGEPPTFEVLAVDSEPTAYEIEIKQNAVLP